MLRPASIIAGLTAAVLVACSAAPSETTAADEIAESLADDNAPLLVKDPRTLVGLEERGLSLAGVLGTPGATGADLATNGAYDRIVATIAFDLKRLRMADPRSGVGVDFPHRQLDPEWLRSRQSRFELVAVVNRLDRMHAGGCGEMRLIYRLAYRAPRSESRLPVTFNVIFPQTGDCKDLAQRWLRTGPTAAALLDGPLASLPRWERIEIDYQAVRWPSNERRDMGGHAEYILRAFRRTADSVEQAPLENTPRTNLSEDDKEELRSWIRDHIGAIDEGTAIVPEKFLATHALSVGPHGLARAANRSFSQLFPDANAAFGDVAMPDRLATPVGLLRRLDSMTCHGCHQSRSIAGFHLLGEERDNDARLNALAIGRSPHMLEELPWRTDFVRAIAKGERPSPRPFAEHADSGGKIGAHCGLGRDRAFATWTCAEGLACHDLHGGPVGVCSPADAPVGDSCETITLTSNPDSHRDRLASHAVAACNDGGRGARCNPASQGFPDGLCRTDCTDAEVGTIEGTSICGLVPSASGLTQCLAAHRPFKECLAADNTPTFLRTCDRTEPCRDDYACMRVKGGPAGIGACMPPYFAFQARVDGHLLD
jgi:hypothetical protein